MTKLIIVSDLHLEFHDIDIKNENNADVLILAGDIMIAQDLHDFADDPSIEILETKSRRAKAKRFRNFLSRMSSQFKHVIYCAGNHEFFNGKWVASLTYLRDECNKYPNIHFLENENVVIDDITFIGGTLWTDLNKGDPITVHAIGNLMNDYHSIRNDSTNYRVLRPSDTIFRHKTTLNYIRSIVEQDNTKKYVVIGHHAPTKLSTHYSYEDEYIANGAYSSDLSDFILKYPQIKVWCHGHTHNVFDYVVGSTRIICNPRGYEGYEPDSEWDKTKIVEV